MRRKRLLMLIGSVCLALMLVVPLVASCGPATPEEAAEEIAALESKLAAEKAKVSGLQGDVSDLEAEIAELRAPGEVQYFTLQPNQGPGTPIYEATEWMCEETERATGGQIVVEQVMPSSIVGSVECFEAVGTGGLDATITYGSYFPGLVPPASPHSELPGDPRTWWELLHFWYEGGERDFLRPLYAEHNVLLATVILYPGQTMISVKPVGSIADMQKLKFRAVGEIGEVQGMLGTSTVFIPYEELYMALQSGTIDGITADSWSGYWLSKFYEVAKHMNSFRWTTTSTGDYLVNMDRWNELSPALQSTWLNVMETAANRADYNLAYWERIGEAKLQVEGGCTMHHFSDADIQVLLVTAAERWEILAAASPLNAEYLAMVNDDLVALGYKQ